ncbi:hypothetical protein T07_12285 [Trichinella nelsoni]|uniref:Uncharacterized protein n=1 Tax=Trichinella nelsoni TaxID=6336 RepID=A0A0V0RD18_9BILA|nr:hypothetical protein T07_12285 [Trichinella nelsoni]
MWFEEISKAMGECREGKLTNGSVTSEHKLPLKAKPIVLQTCSIRLVEKLADKPVRSEPKISSCLFICQTVSVGIQQPS